MATIDDIITEYVGDTNARSAISKVWRIMRDCMMGPSQPTAMGMAVSDLMMGLPDNPYWQKFGAAVIPSVASIARMSMTYHIMLTQNSALAERLKGIMLGTALSVVMSMFSETNNAGKFDQFVARLMQAE